MHTAQMIPVLISLVHSVLETANIHEEIDQLEGIKGARDIARDWAEKEKLEKDEADGGADQIHLEQERKDVLAKLQAVQCPSIAGLGGRVLVVC